MASILRTLQSPGVELREFDRSQIAPGIQGSYGLVMGFANSGPIEQPIVGIGDIQSKNAIFGEPTNEAERYFHYGCEEVIRNGGTLVAARIGYDTINIDKSRTLSTIKINESLDISGAVIHDVIRASEFFDSYAEVEFTQLTEMGDPLMITDDEYQTISVGQDFPTRYVDNDFIVINKTKEVYDENLEGLITLMIDPVDAITVQMLSSSASDSDQVVIFNGIKGLTVNDLAVNLSASIRDTSVSERAAQQFKSLDFSHNGEKIDKSFANHLGFIVCRVDKDFTMQGLHNVHIIEAFVGSVHKGSRDASTGLSDYLIDVINANSTYFEIFENPRNNRNETKSAYLSALTIDTVLWVAAELEVPFVGIDSTNLPKSISFGALSSSMNRILDKLNNKDDIQLDYVVDGGLSSIAQFVTTEGNNIKDYYGIYAYDLSGYNQAIHGSIENYIEDHNPPLKTSIEYTPGLYSRRVTSSESTGHWRSICNKLIEFCQNTRKDCMTFLDVPRNLVVDGNVAIIRPSKSENRFSESIAPNLRWVIGLNSSYAASYSNWTKVIDVYTGTPLWLPPSIKALGTNVRNDISGNEFDAPAGLNYGRLTGVVELSFTPSVKDADQLYTKSLNYAKHFSIDGFVLEGQKTTQTKPSAFDRINVRKLFLRVSREVYNISRYMVYEPNNFYTRRRFVDLVEPTLKRLSVLGRIYNYRIVCNEQNNTPDVIDRNELKLALFIQPTRTAEFILIDIYADRTATTVTETF